MYIPPICGRGFTPRVRTVLGAMVVVMSAVGCGEVRDRPETLPVDPPPNLEQLDLAVREQFEDTWQSLTELRRAWPSDTEVGAAWGALGQWFDVYDYRDSATRCYENARRLDPRQPRWPYYTAMLAEENGDFETAAAGYETARALAPTEAASRVRLGDIAQRRADLAAAETCYRDVLAEHPASPGALLGMARVAMQRGDPQSALEPLQSLITAQPEAAEVHYALSLVWRQLGDEQRAAEHLGRIPDDNLEQIPLMRDDPWELELHRLDHGARLLTRRAVRAFRRGNTLEAAILFGQAVSADPVGPEERVNYAVALREIGRPRAAHRQLEAALARAEPGSDVVARAHLETARLLVAAGRPEDAELHVQTALAIDPRSAPGHIELGRVHQLLGRLESAAEHYGAAATIDPGARSALFWHAAMLTILERREEALTLLESALRSPDADRSLGLLAARILAASSEPELRDTARAQKLLERWSESAPDVLFAETAAMVAAEAGMFDAACRLQRAAVEALANRTPRAAAHRARRRMVLYEQKQPCRTPWEEREALVLSPVNVE